MAYADKRAGQRLESMSARFASWERRYPPRDDGTGWDRATVVAIHARARRLEADVCALAATPRPGSGAWLDRTRDPGRTRRRARDRPAIRRRDRGRRRPPRGRRRAGPRRIGRVPPEGASMTDDVVPVALFHGDDAFGLEREARAFGERDRGRLGHGLAHGPASRRVAPRGRGRREGRASSSRASRPARSSVTGRSSSWPTRRRWRGPRLRGHAPVRDRQRRRGQRPRAPLARQRHGQAACGVRGAGSPSRRSAARSSRVDLPRDMVSLDPAAGPLARRPARRPGRAGARRAGSARSRRAATSTDARSRPGGRRAGEARAVPSGRGRDRRGRGGVVAERLPASLFAPRRRRRRTACAGRRQVARPGAAATTPPPVLVARIHRRLHDIVIAHDLAARAASRRSRSRGRSDGCPRSRRPRARPTDERDGRPDLGKVEWRVDRLLDEARRWTDEELAGALDGLLAADAAMKGERSASERANVSSWRSGSSSASRSAEDRGVPRVAVSRPGGRRAP